jgi:hypothetical protein
MPHEVSSLTFNPLEYKLFLGATPTGESLSLWRMKARIHARVKGALCTVSQGSSWGEAPYTLVIEKKKKKVLVVFFPFFFLKFFF